ncbi:Kinesin light chain 2 [Fusarium oxysporum f. sp. albedinis]|nr:Kinesin light chain 2 [Fusarium oxysporum f. sp. albedinis]
MYLSTFLLIQACSLVCAQVVSPYPVSNCDGLAGTDLQCPDQPGCCSGGAMCCAGGCCPLSAVCVNSGTSNEQCCDLSDKSLCGAAVTDSVRSLSHDPDILHIQ